MTRFITITGLSVSICLLLLLSACANKELYPEVTSTPKVITASANSEVIAKNKELDTYLESIKPEGLVLTKVLAAVFETGQKEMYIAAFGFENSLKFQKIFLIADKDNGYEIIEEIKNDSVDSGKTTIDISLVRLSEEDVRQLKLTTMLQGGPGEMMEIHQMQNGHFRRIYGTGDGTIDTNSNIYDADGDGIDEISCSSTYNDTQRHTVTYLYRLKDGKIQEVDRKISYGNAEKRFMYPTTGEDLVKSFFEALALDLEDEVRQMVEVHSNTQLDSAPEDLINRILAFDFQKYIGSTFHEGFSKEIYMDTEEDVLYPSTLITIEGCDFSLSIDNNREGDVWKIVGFSENRYQ